MKTSHPKVNSDAVIKHQAGSWALSNTRACNQSLTTGFRGLNACDLTQRRDKAPAEPSSLSSHHSAPLTKTLCHCKPHCWRRGRSERREGRHRGKEGKKKMQSTKQMQPTIRDIQSFTVSSSAKTAVPSACSQTHQQF